MKKIRKHRVLNGELILAELVLIPLFLFFFGAALFAFSDKVTTDAETVGFMWGVAILLFAGAILCFVMMRHYHEFDAKGIKVCFFNGKYQYIKWTDVEAVMVWSTPCTTRGGALLDLIKMIFFVYRKYVVVGKYESNLKRDNEFIISKSFRTTKYINSYWNGEIEGTFDKKATKKKMNSTYNSERVRAVEKKTVNKAETVITKYREKFKGLGIDLRRSYIYNYEDKSGISAVRPADPYTYDVQITLHEKNKDHNVNITFCVTLVRVGPGSEEILGFEQGFEEELDENLRYYYDEIGRLGLENCIKNEETAIEILNSEVKKNIIVVTCFAVAAIIAVAAFAIILA